MSYDLQSEYHFNFTPVRVGFFFDVDKHIVEEIPRDQFVTHPYDPKINANSYVNANLTARVGLESTSRIIKILMAFHSYKRPTPTLINIYGINFDRLLRRENGNLQTCQ